MKHIVLALLLPLLPPVEAAEQPIVAFGRATANVYADAGPECPADLICLDSWYRFTLQIDRALHGRVGKRRIYAVRLQHSSVNRQYLKSLRLFVLEPIPGADTRRALGADYYLKQASPRHEAYCIGGAPGDVGARPESMLVVSKDRYCFEESALSQ